MRCAPPSSRKFPCAANSRTNKAVTAQPANPLHGVTLETMVTALSDHYGWEDLGQRIAIRCFTFEPSVPSSLIQQASSQFVHCTVSRAYGSTEVPLVSPGIRSRADAAFGATTDGECAADVQILADDGTPVAPGESGEIVARAPRMFMRYINPEDNASALTADGYFRMGDVGRLVAGKFIEITGRKKDIIIRMGENISPLEIENALAEHAAIKQVAIVGIPDARTGEAALAFVVLNEGTQFSLKDMTEFLSQRGLARQKFPEHLRVVASLPTNSVGKVLKRELQALAASEEK